jgi:hypothetical protein
VIRCHDQRALQRNIFHAMHFEFHDPSKQPRQQPQDKSSQRRGMKDKLLSITRIEFNGIGQGQG